MSLKTFHIFFIGCAILLALGCGVWAMQSYLQAGKAAFLVAGFISLFAGAGLILYGIRFLKKLKHVSFL